MIEEIIIQLENKKIGIIPTETVLGLCTIFDNIEGIEKIYELKKRPRDKKLSIIFENFDQIKNNFNIKLPYEFKKLALFFWPGPLTIILEDNNNVTYGFRKPQDEISLYILSKLKKPLVCTSVNISNQKPIQKVNDLSTNFKNNVDFIVNCDAKGLVNSTVYDLKNDKILRHGPVSYEQIHKVLDA